MWPYVFPPVWAPRDAWGDDAWVPSWKGSLRYARGRRHGQIEPAGKGWLASVNHQLSGERMGRSWSAVFADFHGVNSLFGVKVGQGCGVPSMEGRRGGEHSQLSRAPGAAWSTPGTVGFMREDQGAARSPSLLPSSVLTLHPPCVTFFTALTPPPAVTCWFPCSDVQGNRGLAHPLQRKPGLSPGSVLIHHLCLDSFLQWKMVSASGYQNLLEEARLSLISKCSRAIFFPEVFRVFGNAPQLPNEKPTHLIQICHGRHPCSSKNFHLKHKQHSRISGWKWSPQNKNNGKMCKCRPGVKTHEKPWISSSFYLEPEPRKRIRLAWLLYFKFQPLSLVLPSSGS